MANVVITLTTAQVASVIQQANATGGNSGGPIVLPPPPPLPPAPIPPGGNFVRATADWNAPTRLHLSFGLADVLCVKFHTGNLRSDTNNLSRIACAEDGGGAADMIACLSYQEGDFLHPIGGAVQASQGGSGGASAPTIPFTVANPYIIFPGYYPDLTKNTDVFFNLKNYPGNGVTGSRNVFVDLSINGTYTP